MWHLDVQVRGIIENSRDPMICQFAPPTTAIRPCRNKNAFDPDGKEKGVEMHYAMCGLPERRESERDLYISKKRRQDVEICFLVCCGSNR